MFLNRKAIKVFLICVTVFILDTMMKLIVGFNDNIDYSILFVKLRFCANTRIADMNFVILVLVLLLIGVICFVYVEKYIALSFVLAGCLSNFADFLIWGFVIDYIKIDKIILNLSDISIIFGLLLTSLMFINLKIREIFTTKKKKVS